MGSGKLVQEAPPGMLLPPPPSTAAEGVPVSAGATSVARWPPGGAWWRRTPQEDPGHEGVSMGSRRQEVHPLLLRQVQEFPGRDPPSRIRERTSTPFTSSVRRNSSRRTSTSERYRASQSSGTSRRKRRPCLSQMGQDQRAGRVDEPGGHPGSLFAVEAEVHRHHRGAGGDPPVPRGRPAPDSPDNRTTWRAVSPPRSRYHGPVPPQPQEDQGGPHLPGPSPRSGARESPRPPPPAKTRRRR